MLSDAVRSALIDPRRSGEVQGWLRGNSNRHKIALEWRGDDGETMMHWAFMSSWTLAMELNTIGLSYQDLDNYGRTPMDWLSDRIWSAIVLDEGKARLSLAGQERLRKHTEEQVLGLWSLGVRPTLSSERLHIGVVWLRSGAWDLMDLIKDEVLIQPSEAGIPDPKEYNGPCPGWMNWMPKKGTALHAWVLSPDNPGRRLFLKKWKEYGLDIDVRDEDGRTPLWYAVEAYFFREDYRPFLLKVIKELVNEGADTQAEDVDAVSPVGMATADENSWSLHLELLKVLGLEFNDNQDDVIENNLNPSKLDLITPTSDD